jgi:hypothetical protein
LLVSADQFLDKERSSEQRPRRSQSIGFARVEPGVDLSQLEHKEHRPGDK